MALLPQKVGRLTLVRALENDGVCQSYVGILDDALGTQVIARKLLPALGRSQPVREAVQARLGDLLPLRHPGLVPLTHSFDHDGDLYVVHEWADTVSLADVVAWCRTSEEPLPLNMFLHFAVQICNALEGLHGVNGATTQAPNVLHLQLRPSGITVTREGQIQVGDYGLLQGPTFATQTGGYRLNTTYLSPEQTHADARQVADDEDDSNGGLRNLSPASDVFSLGAVLYELLVQKPMFQGGTPLRTLAMVRRAEVTTQLLEVKEVFPGVDRVLYRALSLHPRHRYQRAFVLREDLRGLMAEFSFSNIDAECRRFLAPLFKGTHKAVDDLLPQQPRQPLEASETEPTVFAKIDVEAIRRGLAPPKPFDEPFPDDFDDDPLDYAGGDGAPTGAFDAPSSAGPVERPLNYAADGPDVNWTDVMPAPAAPRRLDSEAIRDGLADPIETEEILPTEEKDLFPVDVPLGTLPPGALLDVHDPHGAETQILHTADPELEAPEFHEPGDERLAPLSIVLGAGLASLVAVAITLCAGGGLIAAVATRSPNVEPTPPIEPASRRLLIRPTGTRGWRSVPTNAALELPVMPPARPGSPVQAALTAMDEGGYRAALDALREVDPLAASPTVGRAVSEIRGCAHRELYERSSSRDPLHLHNATLAWTTYLELAESPAHTRHAEAQLAYLKSLQR